MTHRSRVARRDSTVKPSDLLNKLLVLAVISAYALIRRLSFGALLDDDGAKGGEGRGEHDPVDPTTCPMAGDIQDPPR